MARAGIAEWTRIGGVVVVIVVRSVGGVVRAVHGASGLAVENAVKEGLSRGGRIHFTSRLLLTGLTEKKIVKKEEKKKVIREKKKKRRRGINRRGRW